MASFISSIHLPFSSLAQYTGNFNSPLLSSANCLIDTPFLPSAVATIVSPVKHKFELLILPT